MKQSPTLGPLRFNCPSAAVAIAFVAIRAAELALAQAQVATATAAHGQPSFDKVFVQAASMSSSTEIDASKLAVEQSQSADVRSFVAPVADRLYEAYARRKMAMPHGVAGPKKYSVAMVFNSFSKLYGEELDTADIKQVGLAGRQKPRKHFKLRLAVGQTLT